MPGHVEYGQPRRLNAVSLTMLLMFAAFAYAVWRFFPHWFDAWTVDHTLKVKASEVYNVNRLGEPDRTNALIAIVEKAKAEIRTKAGINDPELTVSMRLEGDKALLVAEYDVVVTHALVSKTTRVHFKRQGDANIKTVDWDKQ